MSIPRDETTRAALIAKHGAMTVHGIYTDPAEARLWLAMSEAERKKYEWEVLRGVNDDGVRYAEQNPGEAVGYNTSAAERLLGIKS